MSISKVAMHTHTLLIQGSVPNNSIKISLPEQLHPQAFPSTYLNLSCTGGASSCSARIRQIDTYVLHAQNQHLKARFTPLREEGQRLPTNIGVLPLRDQECKCRQGSRSFRCQRVWRGWLCMLLPQLCETGVVGAPGSPLPERVRSLESPRWGARIGKSPGRSKTCCKARKLRKEGKAEGQKNKKNYKSIEDIFFASPRGKYSSHLLMISSSDLWDLWDPERIRTMWKSCLGKCTSRNLGLECMDPLACCRAKAMHIPFITSHGRNGI